MGKRFIRKQPLLSKIKSYPFDLLIYVNELRLSIEWDQYAETVALTLGISLLILYLVIAKVLNYYDIVHSKSDNALFQTNYNNYERLKARLLEKNITINSYNYTFVYALKWLNRSLLMVSIVSAYIIITSTRSYNLLYCNEKPHSPSARKLNLNQMSLYEKIKKYLAFERLFYDKSSDEAEEVEINLTKKEIYQLTIWDPSKFLLFLEIPFNPLNLMVLQFYSVNFFLLKTLTIVSILSLVFYLLTFKFLTLINDKQILYQEMFSEFNNKFVKPKANIFKKDVSIDSTKGPYASTVFTDIKPYSFSKSKVFVTHDAQGNQIKNYESDASSNSSSSMNSNSIIAPRFEIYKKFQTSDSSNPDDIIRVRSENDELKFKNDQLQKQLHFFTRQPVIYNENDDENDNNSISTPLRTRNFDSINRDRNINSISNLSVQNIPFKSPHISRTPSPSKGLSRTSSPTRSLHRTPSPVRSPHRTPFRRESDIYGRSPSLKSTDLYGRPDLSPELRNNDFRRSPILRNNDFKSSSFVRSDMNKSPSTRTSNSNRSPSASSERYLDRSLETKPRWR